MKLHEIAIPLEDAQLNEITLQQALKIGKVAGAVAGTALGIATFANDMQHYKTQQAPAAVDVRTDRDELADRIAGRYKISTAQAKQIVNLAYKYADPVFPRAIDILAVIGVESSFDPMAKSNLRFDPAVGLMQVRPGKWRLHPEDLSDVESQIKHGSEILRAYYKKLKNKDNTLQAYNIGITAYRSGERNPSYSSKVNNELAQYKDLDPQIAKQPTAPQKTSKKI